MLFGIVVVGVVKAVIVIKVGFAGVFWLWCEVCSRVSDQCPSCVGLSLRSLSDDKHSWPQVSNWRSLCWGISIVIWGHSDVSVDSAVISAGLYVWPWGCILP